MNDMYGCYRTRKFTDIFPDCSTFSNNLMGCGVPVNLTQENINTLFYLLYARYGNSHIASSDETQFCYKVYSIIFMYGATWQKRLEVQDKLRNLTETELLTGAKSINNHAMNPSTLPTTDTLEEIDFINEQATTQFKKNKLDAYGTLLTLLKSDVTDEFLSKFKRLFLTVVQPQTPLWYVTDSANEIEEDI